jgi:DNA-binding NtrC family response regulator
MSELQETAEGARQAGRTEAPRVQTVEGHRANLAAWHILVADDDAGSRELSEDILSAAGYRVVTAEDGQAAWEMIQANPIDLVLSDLSMPRMDGMGLLRAVGDMAEPPSVILMTAYSSLDSAVEATKLGAYGYMSKPVSIDRLCHLVGRALEERYLQRENRRLQRELARRQGLAQIIGESPPIRELTRLIEVVAPSDATILILGKSGTGKELVARAIHSLSRRKERPFIAVNCGGLSETLLESELFGHVRGAFTGAVGFKRGLIQSADSGTLFLDEVGEMSPALQVKMLRTLQDGEVRPLGTEQSTKVDVRVIAATNRDLRKAVAAGQFREDLFYRLNVISFTTPDLTDRREDIPVLAAHFLDQTCARLGRKSPRIVPEVMDLLQSYPWPGNVRELRNTIERAIALVQKGEIRPHHLPPEIRATDPVVGAAWWRGETALVDLERQAILHALKKTQGNRVAAAKLLGISERSLYRKLDRHKLRDAPPL